MSRIKKIGLGGGCHWCTEAVYQSLIGVDRVEQGWVSSTREHHAFSEAVIVHFDPDRIPLEAIVHIHLLTHKSTSAHSMRNKYRSAVYYFDRAQQQKVKHILEELQLEFDKSIITKVLPFMAFKGNEAHFLNYYYSNPSKPFCETYIAPKLQLLLRTFGKHVNKEKLESSMYSESQVTS